MTKDNKNLQAKIFNIMLLFIIILCSYFLISGISLKMTPIHHIKWIVIIVITSILLKLSLNHPGSLVIRKATIIILIFLIIPSAWLSTASNAQFPIGYIIISLMSIYYFYVGKDRVFYITSIIIIATALMTYQIIYPENFISYTKSQLIIHTLIQVPVIFIIAVYMLGNFTDTLRRNNKILETLCTHDDITGIFNRRYIYNLLNSIKNESTQVNPSLVGLIDIDYFKSINDTYGHHKGDKVIKSIASHLQEVLGTHGVVGRYGGDEFIVIFENCNTHPCENIINQLSSLVELNKEFSLKNTITISGGFALYDGTTSIDTCLALADKRLYKAKLNGRNQVITC